MVIDYDKYTFDDQGAQYDKDGNLKKLVDKRWETW
jgi:predicted metalloendopeptidase